MHFAKYTAKTSSNKVTVCLILVIFKYTYKFQFVEQNIIVRENHGSDRTVVFSKPEQ